MFFLNLLSPKDEFWISLFVLLSRAPSLEALLCLRLPPREAFAGGPPANMLAEMQRLRVLEHSTLLRLHGLLQLWQLPDAIRLATEPLLATYP